MLLLLIILKQASELLVIGLQPSTLFTAAEIRDFGKKSTPSTRWKFKKAANAYQALIFDLVTKDQEIANLRAQFKKASRGKKRKKILNLNVRFMTVGQILANGGNPNETLEQAEEAIVEEEDEEIEKGEEASEQSEVDDPPPQITTRSGRETRLPARYID
ncbi:hypothetical protein F5Y16DRAFT_416320 [Xylariaceae sp. FL0255]|nr:hypothetical protein F5Y16DRAFT_416320 [Xylariaceae sp. FL0255]